MAMNCESFDLHLMDALYEELDEVTAADVERHAASCARCAALQSGMRATLEVGVLPLEEPSDDLEERILEAAEAAQRHAPWHRKVMYGLSWAGSHAMRPQLAMAALLVLVLGSSLLLLRARPGSVAVTPIKVTEQGAPMPAAEATAAAEDEQAALGEAEGRRPRADEMADEVPSTAATALAAQAAEGGGEEGTSRGDGADTAAQFERAMENYRAGKHREAQQDFAAIRRQGGEQAAVAALYEARTVRWQSGCRQAIAYYGTVQEQFGSSPYAADAAWERADCHKLLGETAQANEIYERLAASDTSYRTRAVNELAARGQAATSGKSAAAAPRRKAAPRPAAPTSNEPAQQQQKPEPADEAVQAY